MNKSLTGSPKTYTTQFKMSSASTGGTEGSSPASSPASAASLAMAAPKFGTLVPNRIFVGGISASTSEAELTQLFSAYGNVKATKIISDRAGVSKGYGFVTFETDEEARRLQQESECIILRERKLNIAPAIKKQPFNRLFDGGSGSPPTVPTSTYYYTNGMGLTYQNGLTFYNAGAAAPGTAIAAPTDSSTLYQAAGIFGPQSTSGHQTFAPVVYSCPTPALYMPQQYQYSPVTYESYYTGATGSGLPQYTLYATTPGTNTHESQQSSQQQQHQQQQPQQSQSNGCVGGNNTGSNNSGGRNGNGLSSPPTHTSLPPPPPPPPSNHYYASSGPPPLTHHHHHPPPPPVATGPMPPHPQMDHLYYSFPAPGPPPPVAPQHQTIGIGDQQLLLYATDPTNCQQISSNTSDNQVNQEVQFYATGLQNPSRYHQQQVSHHQTQHVGQRRFSGIGQSMTSGRKVPGFTSQSTGTLNCGEHLRRPKNKVNGITQGGAVCKIQDEHCLGGGGDATGSKIVNMLPITPPPTPRIRGSGANNVDSVNNTANNDIKPISDVCHQMQALAL